MLPSLTQLAGDIAAGRLSSVEATRAYLDRIERLNPTLNAYLSVDPDFALAEAAEADRRLAAGERAPLLGLPIAVKDIISTLHYRTTCGSRMLETYQSPTEATVITRLRQAGAFVLGKTNTDEFAMGSSTENSAFGPTLNPWNHGRVPGGSSGGSAAAVAAGMAPAALGTDTGGSVRQPAAFCGVTGVKPTYGRVSRSGVAAFASSLDQIGVFGQTAQDCALLLSVLCGQDPLDATSSHEAPPSAELVAGDLTGVVLGVPRECFEAGLEPGVQARVTEAMAELERRGATLREVSLPHSEYALPTYYIIAEAEASANMARYDGLRYGRYQPAAATASEPSAMWASYSETRGTGLGSEVKRRIMLGTYVLSAGYYDAYYLQAQRVRTLIRQDFTAALEGCAALVYPVAPSVAFRLGEKATDPLQMYMADVLTIGPSLAGLPAMSVPCGFSEGMPVGLQLVGRAFDEGTMLSIAVSYQADTNWHQMHATAEGEG